jgi:uncharacterized membrane protein
MNTSTSVHRTDHSQGDSPFIVHRIPVTRPPVWLLRAWRDLRDNPLPSLAYGLVVTVMGAIILMFSNHPYMVAGSLTGFLLVGPIMTTGLCELSRRHRQGEQLSFERSLQALHHNRHGLFGFANRLLAIGVAWMLLSALLLDVAVGSAGPALGDTVWGGAWAALSMHQVLIYLSAWGLLSLLVFSISVVSVPMILDMSTDATTAIRTSLRVSLRDLPAMAVWALLILLLVGLGFATGLVGMILVFPLLGHATWHAYTELVR